MTLFERIGAFLTDSPADNATTTFAGELARLSSTSELHVVHLRGGEEEPAGPDPDPTAFEQRIRSLLPPGLTATLATRVVTESGVPQALRLSRDLSLDLIVMGRRLPASQLGVGSTFAKLARKAPCSVFVVPNHVRMHLSRFLVPVDLSEHSALALQTAIALGRAGAHEHPPQIVVQTVYSVGYGYHYTGVEFAEAVRIAGDAIEKKLDGFLASIDATGVTLERVVTCAEHEASAVHDFAAARKMDVIAIGSRGLSRPASAILGGTAERILLGSPLPVLVVKQKGETTGLLDALLGS